MSGRPDGRQPGHETSSDRPAAASLSPTIQIRPDAEVATDRQTESDGLAMNKHQSMLQKIGEAKREFRVMSGLVPAIARQEPLPDEARSTLAEYNRLIDEVNDEWNRASRKGVA